MTADSVDALVQRLRIVLSGLMAGLMAFAAVSLTIGPLSRNPDPTLRSALLGVLVLLCLGEAMAYRLVHQQIVKRLLARSSELRGVADPSARALPEYQQLFMIRAGLTEGPGLFAVIVHLLTGSLAALVVVAAALALLASQLPSRERVRELAQNALDAA